MFLLLSLPIWVVVLNFLLKPEKNEKTRVRAFMLLTLAALIFVIGLRSRYTGTTDTEIYMTSFLTAKKYAHFNEYFKFDGNWLFSEIGFSFYTWSLAKILPSAQWYMLISTAIMMTLVARFIWKNSEDKAISWLTFICLGSMTFMMNGLRQSLAMSICLLSYEYAKRKRIIPFLLLIFMAVLFHKSSVIFIFVYIICNMKFNWKSVSVLVAAVAVILSYADSFVMFYDELTEETYFGEGVFDSGGLVTILIYMLAIGGTLLLSRHLKEKETFSPFVLSVLGLVIYLCRFTSVQIYERISFYFFYFLMLLFPAALKDITPRYKKLIEIIFILLAISLFIYRINSGAFADFKMFWEKGI